MLLNCGVGEDSQLRVLGTARRSNQSILKEISPEYSLEGLMLKLKLQYFGYLMWRTDSFEKTLMLGKIEGRRRRGQQRLGWLDGITDSMEMILRSWWWTGKPGVLQSMVLQIVGHNWVTELIVNDQNSFQWFWVDGFILVGNMEEKMHLNYDHLKNNILHKCLKFP